MSRIQPHLFAAMLCVAWGADPLQARQSGAPPDAPANLAQTGNVPESSNQAKADFSHPDGWTRDSMTFSGTLTDPNWNQTVRLRVRIRATDSATWTYFDSGLQDQGLVSVTGTLPAGGEYDWEWRVEDSYGNSFPTAYDAWAPPFYNQNSPDFRSDQNPPSVPAGLSPDGSEPPAGVPVDFSWLPSADDSAFVITSYEMQVSLDPEFGELEMETAGQTPAATGMFAPSLQPRYWRVRSVDFVGNASEWSPAGTFRVMSGGGGGGSNGCMKSASIVPSSTALVWLLVVAAALLLRAPWACSTSTPRRSSPAASR